MSARRIAWAAAALALTAQAAHAAINCTAASAGFATAYVPANPGNNVTPGSVTITCQRGAAGDATSVNYSVAVNNGLYNAGGNRARRTPPATYISYDTYQNAACTTLWGNIPAATARISGTMALTGFLPNVVVRPWWGCVPPGQAGTAGTYIDTVTMTARPGANTSTFPVTITRPATCTVSTAPGTITLDYAAFGPVVNASRNFGVTCTSLLPYALSLDATAGVIVGVQYTLSLSLPGGTGNGAEQTYQIDAAAAAGQAGTCAGGSCSGNQTRTLTITY